MAPPGRQKSEREFCLFGGVFLSGAPRRLSGAVAFSKPAAFVAVFVTGAPALFPPVCRCLVPGLRAACRFLFGLRCRGLFAGNVLCAFSRAFFSCLSPFSASLLPLKLLFTCRSGRDGASLFISALRCCFSARVQSAVFAPPAAVVAAFVPGVCLPAVRLCVRAFRLSFAFFCLTFASQTSFHLSLRPRRASTFFRKESRQRFARGRGSAPLRTPIPAPCGQSFPLPRCWPA